MQAFNLFLTATVHVAFAHVFRPTRYGDGEIVAAAMKDKAKSSLHDYFDLIDRRMSDGRPYVHGDQHTISDPICGVLALARSRGPWTGRQVRTRRGASPTDGSPAGGAEGVGDGECRHCLSRVDSDRRKA
jgi:glutathione S-transferase